MATVYGHIREDKNEVFYIGVSNNMRRPYDFTRRGAHWKSVASKSNVRTVCLFIGVAFKRAKELEVESIALFGRKDKGEGQLVNKTDGGEGSLGIIQSAETIAKRFANHEKRVYKPWTQEQRAKMSQIKKGSVVSEATRAKLAITSKGIRHSAETRARMSEIGKQRTYSPETRAKMSESGKNRAPISEETRAKLREIGKQFAQTEAGKEQYRRMAKLANIKRWT